MSERKVGNSNFRLKPFSVVFRSPIVDDPPSEEINPHLETINVLSDSAVHFKETEMQLRQRRLSSGEKYMSHLAEELARKAKDNLNEPAWWIPVGGRRC